MRPQQQNRRMRGRNGGGSNNNNNNSNNNNNRKGPNPLTRNYESNGPDVKIRGSAQQIAEKYAQLARDAHSSGDRVMAENYLQHAEHYNRIIAAAQAQMPIQNPQNQREGSTRISTTSATSSTIRTALARPASRTPARATTRAMATTTPATRTRATRTLATRTTATATTSGRSSTIRRRITVRSLVSGPQPVIEGMPAEVALNPEAAGEGNAPRERSFNGEPSEGRRNRRPRRGERSRPDTAEPDVADSTEGLAATLSRGAPVTIVTPEPAAEVKEGGGAALVDADG